jgi:hypothetical protein
MNEGQIPPVLCQSFHENCWIFKVFEMNWNRQFFDSEVFSNKSASRSQLILE